MKSDLIEVRVLVRRCLDGDRGAMRQLVQRYERIVFGFCLRVLRHYQDAEDVAQETMIRMLRSLHRWDGVRRFEPWLMAIAANRCRTHLQRAGRRGACVPVRGDEPDPRRPPFDHLAWREELERALAELRPEHRSALLLFHSHHMSYAEVAESLEVPIGTVRIWIHRARRALWKWFASRDLIEDLDHAVR